VKDKKINECLVIQVRKFQCYAKLYNVLIERSLDVMVHNYVWKGDIQKVPHSNEAVKMLHSQSDKKKDFQCHPLLF
jgi:hypothetical protein